MRRRALPAALGAAVAFTACREAARPEAVGAETGDRARVVRFWDRFDAATTRRSRGDAASAVGLYREALSLDPHHEDSLYHLGHCLRELGRPVEARQAFEQLLDANPDSARGHQALAALLASPDPAEPLDLSRAERHLRRAHEINGEETGPMVRLAEVLVVTGRLREARDWLDAAARTNPRSIEAAFLAGYLAWEAGDGGSARAFALRAQAAARTEAPVRGVPGEGDRKTSRGQAAPPLANPLGRTLFGEKVSFLRSPSDRPAAYSEFERSWRGVREVRRACRLRAALSR